MPLPLRLVRATSDELRPGLDLDFTKNTEAGKSSSWWNLFKGGTAQPDEFFDAETGAVSYGPHNLLLHSQDISNSAWNKTHGGAVTSVADPFGGANAQQWVPGATLGAGLQQNYTIPFGATEVTLSLWMRVPSGSRTVLFNPNLDSGGSALVTTTWQRFTHTLTGLAPGSAQVRIDRAASNGVPIEVFGLQINIGPLQPYVPTTTTPVYSTRPRITYSGGLGTRIGPTGLVEWGPHNLLADGNTISNWASGGSSGTTRTVTATATPDGTPGAVRITPQANATGSRTAVLPVAGPDVQFTFSAHFRAAEFTTVRMSLTDQSTGQTTADFNLATGQQIGPAIAGGAWTAASAQITALPGGWYRCSLTATKGAGTNCVPYIQLRTNAGSLDVPGDTGSGLFVWGAQLNYGPLQPYYPTTSAAYFGPRFTYDPVTLQPLGLLVEEQRTNLCWPSLPADGTWATGNDEFLPSSFTQNAGIAPDGTNTAVLVTPGVSGNPTNSPTSTRANRVYREMYGSNGPFAVSIWVKTATLDSEVSIFVVDVLTDLTRAIKTVVTSSEWTRISVVGVTAGGTPGLRFVICVQHPVLVWGAQTEFGFSITSYIPTSTASVTRVVESAVMNSLDFSSWYNLSQSTFVIEGPPPPATFSRWFSIYSNSANLIEMFCANPTGFATFLALKDNVNQGEFGSGPAFVRKAGAAYKQNSFVLAVDGSVRGVDIAGDISPVNTFGIGTSPFGFRLNAPISRIRYYPRALPGTTLQELTKP